MVVCVTALGVFAICCDLHRRRRRSSLICDLSLCPRAARSIFVSLARLAQGQTQTAPGPDPPKPAVSSSEWEKDGVFGGEPPRNDGGAHGDGASPTKDFAAVETASSADARANTAASEQTPDQ